MAKQVQGSCNRCGHCGCNSLAGGDDRFYPGIGGSKMLWGKMYPDRDMDICQLIRTAFMAVHGREWDKDYGETVTIRIVGGGSPINVDCYITTSGIQKGTTDASCPFFTLGSPNVCELWGRSQLPPSCANNPQSFTDEAQIAAWEINHPNPPCGYYWIDV